MYVPTELRVIGKLTEDAVAASYAAHDLGGEPVLLVSGLVPMGPADLEPYTRWAEALVGCARHPYVADVVTHGVAEQRAYLAVRTGHRRTLTERLAASGPLGYEQVRHLGVCLADALATAHDAGLCHLAVRPDAIYLDDERGPVLTGFDAAAPVLVRPMASGPLSAPEYRVPRGQLDGQRPVVGAPADVYALAATLYLALGGVLPWSDESPTWVDPTRRATALPDLPGVPPAVLESLRWALAVHPGQRPSAGQLRDALRAPRAAGTGSAAAPGDGTEAAAGLSGLTIPMMRPEDSEDPRRQTYDPVSMGPPTPEPGGHGIEPLTGMWRIVADSGGQELLVVDEQGAVTWSGSDEAGPFVATGEALPLSGGVFRLLLNEPAGSAGFFVDLRLEGGGISFVMDEAPGDGMVDVPSG